MDVQNLNNRYQHLAYQQRLERLFQDFPPQKVLITSSFGTTSMALLHLLSKVKPGHPVHFIDTSYHFPETLAYRDQLVAQLGLQVIDVKADANKNRFTRENRTWQFNQDLCCFINKVEPLDSIKPNFKVWVSGLLGFQSPHRQNLQVFQPSEEILKFHPLIDMSKEDLSLYTRLYELPTHSLLAQGYHSVGCTHCTQKGEGRSGRWFDVAKSECGLHQTSPLLKNRLAG